MIFLHGKALSGMTRGGLIFVKESDTFFDTQMGVKLTKNNKKERKIKIPAKPLFYGVCCHFRGLAGIFTLERETGFEPATEGLFTRVYWGFDTFLTPKRYFSAVLDAGSAVERYASRRVMEEAFCLSRRWV